jgi:hypothetical protein
MLIELLTLARLSLLRALGKILMWKVYRVSLLSTESVYLPSNSAMLQGFHLWLVQSLQNNVPTLLIKVSLSRLKIYYLWRLLLLQVSWVRHRDIHILTVASYTYTSDQRFQAIHQRSNDEWTLQIKYTQKRDAGIYE